jgi:catechol 2,3-dioxygenase-like lactoylglutathione lyase family enzyme
MAPRYAAVSLAAADSGNEQEEGLERMANRGDERIDESRMPDIRRGGSSTLGRYGGGSATDAVVPRAERSLEFVGFDHLGLKVANIRHAERFYSEFFQMDVIQRAQLVGDDWEVLPLDFDWDEGLNTGVYPDLVELKNGPVRLILLNSGRGAVMAAEPRLDHLSFRLTSESLATIRANALVRSFAVAQDTPHSFVFRDPFGITWHLTDVPA